MDYALNYTYELVDYYQSTDPVDEASITRLKTNIDLFIGELGGEAQAKTVVKLSEPYKNEPVSVFPNYNELCRGEKLQVCSL